MVKAIMNRSARFYRWIGNGRHSRKVVVHGRVDDACQFVSPRAKHCELRSRDSYDEHYLLVGLNDRQCDAGMA